MILTDSISPKYIDIMINAKAHQGHVASNGEMGVYIETLIYQLILNDDTPVACTLSQQVS
jgi:hypothetical protein